MVWLPRVFLHRGSSSRTSICIRVNWLLRCVAQGSITGCARIGLAWLFLLRNALFWSVDSLSTGNRLHVVALVFLMVSHFGFASSEVLCPHQCAASDQTGSLILRSFSLAVSCCSSPTPQNVHRLCLRPWRTCWRSCRWVWVFSTLEQGTGQLWPSWLSLPQPHTALRWSREEPSLRRLLPWPGVCFALRSDVRYIRYVCQFLAGALGTAWTRTFWKLDGRANSPPQLSGQGPRHFVFRQSGFHPLVSADLCRGRCDGL